MVLLDVALHNPIETRSCKTRGQLKQIEKLAVKFANHPRVPDGLSEHVKEIAAVRALFEKLKNDCEDAKASECEPLESRFKLATDRQKKVEQMATQFLADLAYIEQQGMKQHRSGYAQKRGRVSQSEAALTAGGFNAPFAKRLGQYLLQLDELPSDAETVPKFIEHIQHNPSPLPDDKVVHITGDDNELSKSVRQLVAAEEAPTTHMLTKLPLT